MPGFIVHFAIGAATGAMVNTVLQLNRERERSEHVFDVGEVVLSAMAAGAGACLPDLLEPANSPFHRGFFHSVAAGALVAYAISGKHTLQLGWFARMLLWMVGLGYLSHLAADATTPRSISFA